MLVEDKVETKKNEEKIEMKIKILWE